MNDDRRCPQCGAQTFEVPSGSICENGHHIAASAGHALPGGSRAEAAVEGALTTVAGAAGPFGALVTGGLAYRNNVILRAWVEKVENEYRLAGRIFNSDDPVTVAVFNRLTIAALQTARTDKREMLARAMAGVLPSAEDPDFLQERLSDIAVRYTPEHARMLALIEDPGGVLRGEDGSATVLQVVSETIFRGHDDAQRSFELVLRDLYDDGLTTSNMGRAGVDSLIRRGDGLTDWGRRFSRFLRPPSSSGLS